MWPLSVPVPAPQPLPAGGPDPEGNQFFLLACFLLSLQSSGDSTIKSGNHAFRFNMVARKIMEVAYLLGERNQMHPVALNG